MLSLEDRGGDEVGRRKRRVGNFGHLPRSQCREKKRKGREEGCNLIECSWK